MAISAIGYILEKKTQSHTELENRMRFSLCAPIFSSSNIVASDNFKTFFSVIVELQILSR
jgi:hypothetical protein